MLHHPIGAYCAVIVLALAAASASAGPLQDFGLLVESDFEGYSNSGFNAGSRFLIGGNLTGGSTDFKGDVIVGGAVDASLNILSAGPGAPGDLSVAGALGANVNVAGDVEIGGAVGAGLNINGQVGRSFTHAGPVGGGTNLNNFSSVVHDPLLTVTTPAPWAELNALSTAIDGFASSHPGAIGATLSGGGLSFSAGLAQAVSVAGADVVIFNLDAADLDSANNIQFSIDPAVEAVLVNVTGAAGPIDVTANFNGTDADAAKTLFNFAPGAFSGVNTIDLSNSFYAGVLAPGADLTVSGGNGVTGTVAAHSVLATAQIHPAAPGETFNHLPEPASLTVLALGALALLRRRRGA
jgi:choice-of-anchor A domain-containing protein/MYXO-CTERM domain-containing protein